MMACLFVSWCLTPFSTIFQLYRGGTSASSTTKTGRHDIAEILLKVALNTKNQIKSLSSIVG